MPEGDPAAHLEAGTWVTADTIEGLAEATGLPADVLASTVSRFNGFAEVGVDEDFGRGEDEYDVFFAGGTGPNKALTPCDQPPFYAARFVLSDLGTKGGLVTDAAGRVLREDGSAIAGLYACGNTSASVFGSVYPGPGAPLGSAMVFASLAVRDIVGSLGRVPAGRVTRPVGRHAVVGRRRRLLGRAVGRRRDPARRRRQLTLAGQLTARALRPASGRRVHPPSRPPTAEARSSVPAAVVRRSRRGWPRLRRLR